MMLQPEKSMGQGNGQADYAAAVEEGLLRARRLLPSQAPLSVFIAQNTLQAFQHLSFHEAVLHAKQVYGAEPYLTEDKFREHLQTGRIRVSDLKAALSSELPTAASEVFLEGLLDSALIRMSMLRFPIQKANAASLAWLIRERGVTRRLRDDVDAEARARFLGESTRFLRGLLAEGSAAGLEQLGRLISGAKRSAEIAPVLRAEHGALLERSSLTACLEREPERFSALALWTICQDLTRDYVPKAKLSSAPCHTHRELLLERTGEDVYDRVFPVMLRRCAAYLDDGLAAWSMPERELGFYRSVRKLVAQGSASPMGWMHDARRDFRMQIERDLTATDAIEEALAELGVPSGQVAQYVEAMLLSLPGWAGMISRLEQKPGDRMGGAPASLADYLAVRITYERAAVRSVARRRLGAKVSLGELWSGARSAKVSETELPVHAPYCLFQLLQLLGVPIPSALRISKESAHRILSTMDGFDELSRRRIFQEAFELHYRVQALDALAENRAALSDVSTEKRPDFQFITCFDDREESLRRHLEELSRGRAETFGAPGFFGAAIRFRALHQRFHVALAPVLIQPSHHIDERPRGSDAPRYARQQKRLRFWTGLRREMQAGSLSLWRGILLDSALGLLAAFPLIVRIASPRAAGRIQRFARNLFLAPPRTALSVHHEEASDGPARGFKVDERVSRVATVLENIGLTKRFAKLVMPLGHGANTLNNPHASAYDCGACGGRQGGPNARVFAHMANDAEVRKGLAALGIDIPDDTYFLGGQHDTCSDGVAFFDQEGVPATHHALYGDARALLRQARARNAQERCRRMAPFSAPVDPSPEEALRHVQSRAEHLAEPRPELSHQADAIAIIGRRAVTRGLFLDRRAFLLSYDPGIDPEGKILERAMAAAVPVAAGINLQYYFSCVDNERYGAGSKLPHNIVGLIGVMSGHASDLRTGLPRQMIDVHEPQRLLLVVEATPERLLAIAENQPEIKQLVENHWLHLVSMDPDSGALQVYAGRGFEPYHPTQGALACVQSSDAYFKGKGAGPLPPARIIASASGELHEHA